MKSRQLKRTGLILVLAGLVGITVTAVGMFATYRGHGDASTTSLAETLSGSLPPAAVGTPLILAGLILFLLGWWRARRELSA